MTNLFPLVAPYAVPLEGRLGRIFSDPPDDYRLPFQRDRDRIMHASAFRRLQGKTQVFEVGESDHFRTRLTHSLEVSQVSRDLGRRLRLNEDLCECLALAHDLGHPPFGHSGEEALDTWLAEKGEHFEHNEHSLRIVTVLEKHSSLYQGLNLNREVLEGLQKHVALKTTDGAVRGHTLEAQLVDNADAIGYTAHDTDDGIAAHIFKLKEVTDIPLAKRALERSSARGTRIRGSLLSMLMEDLFVETERRIASANIRSIENVEATDIPLVGFSEAMESELSELQNFLRSTLYEHPRIHKTRNEGQRILAELCTALEKNPTEKLLEHQSEFSLSLPLAIRDFVAGMTDSYARRELEKLTRN